MALNFGPETALTDDAPAQPTPPLAPAEIAPHFPQLEILELLGRGGMGVVYKARQKSLGRLVALKLLAPEREKEPQFAERFAREAQALAQLDHPHIVTVYDFGQSGPFFYLLMEFVDGVNLRQLLRARNLSPEEALAIVPPLCEALQFAHERGIVHRDIKPENLLLTRDGRVKIADFGIAKMLGAEIAQAQAAAEEERIAGTPGYMAPEQKESPRRADSRADIYSLGVVFYEMLTGELPANKIEPPSRKVQVDVRIDEVVLRALEHEPELRFQTAAEMGTRVETIGNDFANQRISPPTASRSGSGNERTTFLLWGIPWQIWAAIALLGLEGIGNLLAIPAQPEALLWLAAKALFITGLLMCWRPVFVLVLAIAGWHVVYFAASAPVVAVMNLALCALIGSAFRFYFESPSDELQEDQLPKTSAASSLGAQPPPSGGTAAVPHDPWPRRILWMLGLLVGLPLLLIVVGLLVPYILVGQDRGTVYFPGGWPTAAGIGVVCLILTMGLFASRRNRRRSFPEAGQAASPWRLVAWAVVALIAVPALLLTISLAIPAVQRARSAAAAAAVEARTRHDAIQANLATDSAQPSPQKIEFRVTRVEVPAGTRNIVVHFDRDPRPGLGLEVTQDITQPAGVTGPQHPYRSGEVKTWVGPENPRFLSWTLPADFTESEVRGVAKVLEARARQFRHLTEGAMIEFASAKHRDGWSYHLIARVKRESVGSLDSSALQPTSPGESGTSKQTPLIPPNGLTLQLKAAPNPGSPQPPAPDGALFTRELQIVVPQESRVALELYEEVNDGDRRRLAEKFVFKTAIGSGLGVMLRWRGFGPDHPTHGSQWILDLVDPLNGVTFHRFTARYPQRMKLTPLEGAEPSPIPRTPTRLEQDGSHTFARLLQAEHPAPPGEPTRAWSQVEAFVTFIARNQAGDPALFQLPSTSVPSATTVPEAEHASHGEAAEAVDPFTNRATEILKRLPERDLEIGREDALVEAALQLGKLFPEVEDVSIVVELRDLLKERAEGAENIQEIVYWLLGFREKVRAASRPAASPAQGAP